MSGGEDGLVNTWRLDHDTGALTQCGQHSPGQGRVTCVSWSRADPGTLVTGGETGAVISIIDLVSGVTRSCNLGRHMIFSLQCHPYKPDVVVMGCKPGLVLIVNIQVSLISCYNKQLILIGCYNVTGNL